MSQHLLKAILHPMRDHLNSPKKQPPSDPSTTPHPNTITMAPSMVGLTFAKSASFKNDCDVTWCKNVCGFPHLQTYSPEYKAWRNAMKRKMKQDWIPWWKQSTAAQWAAIQAHALTLQRVRQRSGLWQANNPCGERFTQCLDFLLKDIAKKLHGILRDMLRAPIAAVPVADHTPARNDRTLSPSVFNKDVSYLLIQLQQVAPVRGLSFSREMSHQ